MTDTHDQDGLDMIVDHVGPLFEHIRNGRLLLSGDGPVAIRSLASLTRANRRFDLNAEVAIVVGEPHDFHDRYPHLVVDPAVEVLAGTAVDFTYPQGAFTHVAHWATGFADDGVLSERRIFDIMIDGVRRVLDFSHDSGTETLLLLSEERDSDAPTDLRTASRRLALDVVEHLATLAAREDSLSVNVIRTPIATAFDPANTDIIIQLWRSLLAGERAGRSRKRRSPSDESARLMSSTPMTAYKPSTFVIDVDGVVAMLTPGNDYRMCQPIREVIATINRLHDQGHRIVMMTARGSATGIDWEEVTRGQFSAWGLKYHELRFGKPAADYYVDDRMVTVEMLRAMAAGRRFPPSSRAPRLTMIGGDQEHVNPISPLPGGLSPGQ